MAKRKVLTTGKEVLAALNAGEKIVSQPAPPRTLQERLGEYRARVLAALKAQGIDAETPTEALEIANAMPIAHKGKQKLRGRAFRETVESHQRQATARDAALCLGILEELSAALSAGKLELTGHLALNLGAMLTNLTFAENWLEAVVYYRSNRAALQLGRESKLTEEERNFAKQTFATNKAAGMSNSSNLENVRTLLIQKYGAAAALSRVQIGRLCGIYKK